MSKQLTTSSLRVNGALKTDPVPDLVDHTVGDGQGHGTTLQIVEDCTESQVSVTAIHSKILAFTNL